MGNSRSIFISPTKFAVRSRSLSTFHNPKAHPAHLVPGWNLVDLLGALERRRGGVKVRVGLVVGPGRAWLGRAVRRAQHRHPADVERTKRGLVTRHVSFTVARLPRPVLGLLDERKLVPGFFQLLLQPEYLLQKERRDVSTGRTLTTT